MEWINVCNSIHLVNKIESVWSSNRAATEKPSIGQNTPTQQSNLSNIYRQRELTLSREKKTDRKYVCIWLFMFSVFTILNEFIVKFVGNSYFFFHYSDLLSENVQVNKVVIWSDFLNIKWACEWNNYGNYLECYRAWIVCSLSEERKVEKKKILFRVA